MAIERELPAEMIRDLRELLCAGSSLLLLWERGVVSCMIAQFIDIGS
jgi:hypothetical protein